MPRFLHTADWQIGRQYGRFAEDDAVALAEARFAAVQTLARLATEEHVDAILVAGDVFDTQTVADRTLHRMFQAMADYAGPWILIPGNHDAALAESVWTRASRLNAIPYNAHVLLEPRVTEFADAGFAILPAPLVQRQTHDDLTAWFDQANTAEGLLRIGLAHGSVTGQLTDVADSPNPIAADRATTAHLDYLALGDWHGCKQIDARVWYSGTPEQERFKNNGAGQALIVNIEKPGAEPEVTTRRIGQYAWVKHSFELTVNSDLQQVLDTLDALPPMSVIDLTLTGQLDLASHQQLQQALGAAAGRHRSLLTHLAQVRVQPTDEDLAALQADGYVGEVIAELRRRQNASDEPEAAREALVALAELLRARQAKRTS